MELTKDELRYYQIVNQIHGLSLQCSELSRQLNRNTVLTKATEEVVARLVWHCANDLEQDVAFLNDLHVYVKPKRESSVRHENRQNANNQIRRMK